LKIRYVYFDRPVFARQDFRYRVGWSRWSEKLGAGFRQQLTRSAE
jgi:hypothetical protein